MVDSEEISSRRCPRFLRAVKWTTRRQQYRAFVLLLLFVCAAGAPTSASVSSWTDTACVVGNGTIGPYFLTGRPLLCDSVGVYASDSNFPDGLTCILQRDPGRVTFSRAIAPGDTISVLFAALPFSLRSSYEAAATAPAADRSPVVGATVTRGRSRLDEIPPPFKLQLTGAKTFGISVDSRHETRTEQGLQLGINGRLTPGVTLVAAVSDRYSDRLSSGASAARLDNLDDFYFSVTSPRANVRLGQLEYQTFSSTPGLSRRLSGIELGGSTKHHTVSAGGGKLAGLVRQIEFFPQPGRQGPYPLTGGQHPVVPQSERVYLDGHVLERGADRDYTIDYFTGEVSFGPRVVLSERTRVAVAFEETAHTYIRRAAFSQLQSSTLDGRFANEMGLEWEGDDPNAGVGFDLSPADRDSLGQMTGAQLRRSGAEFVGAGKGEYLAQDSLGQTVFVYVGPQNGDNHVRFEFVGAGKGSYIHLGGGAYGFAGSDRGDFDPTIRIIAPEAHFLATNRLRMAQTPIGAIEGSIAGLALQPNRLNDRSQVTDWSHDLSWSSNGGRNGATVTKGLQVDARWRRLGRSEQVNWGTHTMDVTERWFLPTEQRPANLQFVESKAQFAVDSTFRISAEGGTLGGAFTGSRHTETITARPAGWLSTQFEHRRSEAAVPACDTVRVREVWGLTQRWRALGVELSSGLHRESRILSRSLRDRVDGYDFGFQVSGVSAGLAADQVYEGARRAVLSEKRRRLWIDGSLKATPLGVSGTFSASRATRQQVPSRRLFRDYLGQADLRWSLPSYGLAATLNYSLNQLAARDRIDAFIPTARGYGNYRWEDSLLLPDPHGDVARVSGSTGELRPTSVGRKEFTLRRDYGDHSGTRLRALNNLAADLRLNREEAVDPGHIAVTRWIVPWGTLRGKDARVRYMWVHSDASAGLERRFPRGLDFWFVRGQYVANTDRIDFSGVNHERQSFELSGRGTRRGHTCSSWEIALSRQERNLSGYPGAVGIDVLAHQVRTTIGWTVSRAASASTQASVEHLQDRRDHGGALIYGVSPSVSVRFGQRSEAGSLRAAVDYDYVQSNMRTVYIPSISGGYAPGHNARVSLDGRIEVTGSVSFRMYSTLDWLGHRRPLYRLNIQAVSTF